MMTKFTDSYYDPPDDPLEPIYEWLDGEFLDGDPIKKTVVLMANRFNITQQSASELLIDWLKEVFEDLPDDFEQFDAVDDVLSYGEEDDAD